MTREEAIKSLELEWHNHESGGIVETAIDMAISALREQEERSKGCHNCYGNDMAIDAVDNPCWNCKAGHSEWIEKPMTNTDRIRAMSDEELAEFLYWYCPYDEAKMDCEESDCDECVADWLKQPYKEDAP